MSTFPSSNRRESSWHYVKFWSTSPSKVSSLRGRSSTSLNSSLSSNLILFVRLNSSLWMKPRFFSKCTRRKRATIKFSLRTISMEKSQMLGKSLQPLAPLLAFLSFRWANKVWIFPIFFCVTRFALTRLRKIKERTKFLNRLTRWVKKDWAHVVTYKRRIKVNHLRRLGMMKRQKITKQRGLGSQKEWLEKLFCWWKYGENCTKSRNGAWLQPQSLSGSPRKV